MNSRRNRRFRWWLPNFELSFDAYFPTFGKLLKMETPQPQLDAPPAANVEVPSVTGDDLRIAVSPMEHLKATVGVQPAETGALMFADKQGVVRLVVYDTSGRASSTAYTPDIDGFTKLIAGLSLYRDFTLIGVVHSHPRNFTILSDADVEIANRFFGCNPRLQKLYLPIVQSATTGAFGMTGYVFKRPEAGEYALPELVEIKEVPDDYR